MQEIIHLQVGECGNQIGANETLYRTSSHVLKRTPLACNDVNHLISAIMSNITTCFRFPGNKISYEQIFEGDIINYIVDQTNGDLHKLMINMVPSRRLHFFIPSFAPIYSDNLSEYNSLTLPQLIQQMFDEKNMMVNCDP